MYIYIYIQEYTKFHAILFADDTNLTTTIRTSKMQQDTSGEHHPIRK